MGENVFAQWSGSCRMKIPARISPLVIVLSAIGLLASALFLVHSDLFERKTAREGVQIEQIRSRPTALASQNVADDFKAITSSGKNRSSSPETSGHLRTHVIESTLIRGTVLNGQAVDELIKGQSFDQVLRTFSREGDADAMARSDHYRVELEKNLNAAGDGLAIRDLACGAKICVGTFESKGDRSATLLAATTALPADAPMSAAVFHTLPDPIRSGIFIQRLVFSSTANVKEISVPLPVR